MVREARREDAPAMARAWCDAGRMYVAISPQDFQVPDEDGLVDWLECDRIVICSTVEVGTTRRLREKTGKRLVFQPMYGPGQTPSHPFRELKNVGWIILGGNRADTIPVADLYKDYVGAELEIRQTDSDLSLDK